MKKLTKLGILLLVIGLSFLAGTFYRSNSTYGFAIGGIFGLKPQTWRSNPDTRAIVPNFLAPRNLRMEVKANATVDVYILDTEGMKLWASDATVNPVWSATGVTQEIFKLQLTRRGDYGFLIHNPTNSTAVYEIHVTLYGFEQDLIWMTIAFTVAGLVTTVTSFIVRHRQKQEN
jgi:hypothetical protein